MDSMDMVPTTQHCMGVARQKVVMILIDNSYRTYIGFEILSSTIVESLRSHSLNQDVTPQARLSIETLSPDNITAIGELVN